MADDEARAEEIARRVAGTRFRRAFEYYAMADVSPRDDAKRLATCNYGWSTETIDTLLDRGLLMCGPNGWHVLTPLGLAVANHLKGKTDD